MIPASLAGIVFLCSLLPGALFLQQTREHRRAGTSPTTIQELITLIGVGVTITVPVVIVIALVCPGAIADQVRVWRDLDSIDDQVVRHAAELAAAVIGASVGISLAASALYCRHNDKRSGESAWHSALWQEKDSLLNYVEIELKDGRVISGVIYSYDGSPVGEHRDLVLQAPIRALYPDGKRRNSAAARIVIADDEIRTITVQHVTST